MTIGALHVAWLARRGFRHRMRRIQRALRRIVYRWRDLNRMPIRLRLYIRLYIDGRHITVATRIASVLFDEFRQALTAAS